MKSDKCVIYPDSILKPRYSPQSVDIVTILVYDQYIPVHVTVGGPQ
jgi:hypothetical protein